MKQVVAARIHSAKGRITSKKMELRPGRKVLLGQNTRFGGLLYKVLGYGHEEGKLVVHLGR